MVLKNFLETLVVRQDFHKKWLNTLSYMENCGARKIIQMEDSSKVTLMVLKHAAEEARHAFYLKKMMAKVGGASEADPNAQSGPGGGGDFADYSFSNIWGGALSKNYITSLDTFICRYLKEQSLVEHNSLRSLRETAYLLTTYVIEVRANQIYPLYEGLLKKHACPLSVMGIIKEEKGHLREMEEELAKKWDSWFDVVKPILLWEEKLFDIWLQRMMCELNGELNKEKELVCDREENFKKN